MAPSAGSCIAGIKAFNAKAQRTQRMKFINSLMTYASKNCTIRATYYWFILKEKNFASFASLR